MAEASAAIQKGLAVNNLDDTAQATIMVVDDAPDCLILADNLLKDLYKVKVANSGEKALLIAAAEPQPDLILLDVMMPGMDGYEVCKRLKQNPRTMNIPVIFLTGKSEKQEEEKGLELGAVDYITKPISPSIVLARVKNHLVLKAMVDFLRDKNDWLELQAIKRMSELEAAQIVVGRNLPRKEAMSPRLGSRVPTEKCPICGYFDPHMVDVEGAGLT